MEEVWKVIDDWPNYAISNYGHVKRLTTKNSGVAGKILKSFINSTYPCVNLCNGKKRSPMHIHRLVAKAFVPNPLNLPQVNHLDSNRENPRFDNLEWVTVRQNIVHGYKYGYIDAKGESNGHSKLTNEGVILIRSGTLTKSQLAEKLMVSVATVSDVLARRTWKHLA